MNVYKDTLLKMSKSWWWRLYPGGACIKFPIYGCIGNVRIPNPKKPRFSETHPHILKHTQRCQTTPRKPKKTCCFFDSWSGFPRLKTNQQKTPNEAVYHRQLRSYTIVSTIESTIDPIIKVSNQQTDPDPSRKFGKDWWGQNDPMSDRS